MSWICPHCNHASVIRNDDRIATHFDFNTSDGFKRYGLQGTKCPNPACGKASIILVIRGVMRIGGQVSLTNEIPIVTGLIPSNLVPNIKNYPDYIPSGIRQDYQEACSIVELSPKSSATLARRALQGMIRDFWQIKEENLSKAIKELEDKVDSKIWDAIDGVRKVGNIGAHMEKDINTIVEVSPDEATLLIEMIEMLLDEWYIARHDREERADKMKKLADEKQAARKPQNP
ncbi:MULTISPECIES: DUF4145 domain-containing protein [Pantoea]|uniref:DUF4145 domain-containing protein n=1 Tax=Pantoea TaxID=53335 RepID=UPI00080BB2B3|nr:MULTISPECIES: DUF4145 domain-containing protein [Pantoea]MBS6436890.1 DUF4145 domain-containing protein [Pantoea sp.]MDU2728071.1 DUF4145 domain-containing protein [Pantoea sp.]MDU6092784.1 DUF4145 domain-containing protein [Staphylococcus lugdunensis]